MWSGLGDNEVVTTSLKPTPPTPKGWPSLAKYVDDYIFVIAGRNLDTHSCFDASVDIYTIGTETWSQAP